MSLTIKAFETDSVIRSSEQAKERAGSSSVKKNIFGGNLNLSNDPVEQRRKEAQEKAWNIVKNAWKNDKSVDDMIQTRKDYYAKLTKIKEEAASELAAINDDKEVLRRLYDVAPDSKEQGDLELLEKAQDIRAKVSDEELTEQESERLAELYRGDLTEYQNRALELNKRAIELKKSLADTDRQMQDVTSDIYSIYRERLKSNPMLEAKEAAEDILNAANDEIIGMLMQESVDYIDEKLEEAEETAEKNTKEKEERKERLDELKLKRAVQEALIEGTKEAAEKAKAIERRIEAPSMETSEMIDIAQGNDASKDVEQSLDEIKSSMNLLEADLKGIKVDEEA